MWEGIGECRMGQECGMGRQCGRIDERARGSIVNEDRNNGLDMKGIVE